jgi:hypothetical protein
MFDRLLYGYIIAYIRVYTERDYELVVNRVYFYPPSPYGYSLQRETKELYSYS